MLARAGALSATTADAGVGRLHLPLCTLAHIAGIRVSEIEHIPDFFNITRTIGVT